MFVAKHRKNWRSIFGGGEGYWCKRGTKGAIPDILPGDQCRGKTSLIAAAQELGYQYASDAEGVAALTDLLSRFDAAWSGLGAAEVFDRLAAAEAAFAGLSYESLPPTGTPLAAPEG